MADYFSSVTLSTIYWSDVVGSPFFLVKFCDLSRFLCTDFIVDLQAKFLNG